MKEQILRRYICSIVKALKKNKNIKNHLFIVITYKHLYMYIELYIYIKKPSMSFSFILTCKKFLLKNFCPSNHYLRNHKSR